MPAITTQLQQELRHCFGVETIECLETRSWNLSFLGTRKNSSLFIKVLRPRSGHLTRSAASIEFAYTSLRQCIFETSISVLMPFVWPTGTFGRQFDDGLVFVFPFVSSLVPFKFEANRMDEKQWICRAAKGLLAFHSGVRATSLLSSSASTEDDIPHVIGFNAWVKDRGTLLSNAKARILETAPYFDSRNFDLVRRFSSAFLDNIDFSCSSSILIHGDYREDNIFFESRLDRLTLLDFDLCRIGPVEEEIAYAALNFAGARWLYCCPNWRSFWHFLDCYCDASGAPMPRDILWWTAWVISKWVSLAFKEEQVIERTRLLRELATATLTEARMRKVILPSVPQ